MSRLTFILNKTKKKVIKKIKKKIKKKAHTKAISMGRGHGKTSRIIRECIENNGLLVVATYHEKQRLIRDYRISSNSVAYWDEITSGRSRGMHRPLYIDNADLIFENMCNCRVAAMSMSVNAIGEEDESEPQPYRSQPYRIEEVGMDTDT